MFKTKRQSNYSLFEKIYIARCLLKTYLFHRGARLIRTPIVVRGKQYIDFGRMLTTGQNCQLEVNGQHDSRCLVFGDYVNIGNNVRILCAESIRIGNHVLIGSRVTVIDNSHGSYSDEKQDSPLIPPNERELSTAPIVIEDNVWIGDGAVVQKGVKIGMGSIVAANSIVTKNVPNEVIVAGIPARIIKYYNKNTNIWEKKAQPQ